jgi:Cu+-exporting ATPase
MPAVTDSKPAKTIKTDNFNFSVEGMTCPACENTIRNHLLSQVYVTDAYVDCTTGKAVVTTDAALDASPDEIIKSIATVGFTAKIASHGVKPLYFSVEGLSSKDPAKIEESIRNGFRVMFTSEININLTMGRVRLVVAENTDPKEVIQIFKKLGYTAKLNQKEKTYHFAIRGLLDSTKADIKKIVDSLNSLKPYVISNRTDSTTNQISVKVCLEDDISPANELAFQNQLLKDIEAVIKEIEASKNILPGMPRITVELRAEDAPETDKEVKSRFYKKRAILNVIVGACFYLLSSYVPLPLTWTGQFIGVLLGSISLGTMWLTGKDFYKGAWRKFKTDRTSDMDTLIALGTGSAWVYSMTLVLFPSIFPVAALGYVSTLLAAKMTLAVINFGLMKRAEELKKTQESLLSLGQVNRDFQTKYPKRLKPLKQEQINSNAFDVNNYEPIPECIDYLTIKEGDIIEVGVNERFPVEGVIVNDVHTSVEQETLTGEPGWCEKKLNDLVYSGSLNKKHKVYIRASVDGDKGHLHRILEELKKSKETKPPISVSIDKLASKIVPITTVIAIASALGWAFLGPVPALPFAIKAFMSVFLCICPCAVLLSAPISTIEAIYSLFRKGILVRDISKLEELKQVNLFLLDKTGTLTRPVIKETFMTEVNEDIKKQYMQIFASIEEASIKKDGEHPIARAFVTENGTKIIFPCLEVKKDDQGVSGIIECHKNKHAVIVGTLFHLKQAGIEIPQDYLKREDEYAEMGMTPIFGAIDGKCVAAIGLKHELREDAKKCVKDLKDLGLTVGLLTGDKEKVAKAMAEELGITDPWILAGRNSQQKKADVEEARKKGWRVCVVGDGVNDLPAGKAANVSIALGHWTNAASEFNIALKNLNVATLVVTAREMVHNIWQNLWGTMGYNLLSLLVATGIMYPLLHIAPNPFFHSLFMYGSSFAVIWNAKRLGAKIDSKVKPYEPVEKQSRPTTNRGLNHGLNQTVAYSASPAQTMLYNHAGVTDTPLVTPKARVEVDLRFDEEMTAGPSLVR